VLEPDPQLAPPPGGPTPPAPPGVGDPEGGPDPADPGPPIGVRLDGVLLGDLGHPRVDSRLVVAILLREGDVAHWLQRQGIEAEAVMRDFDCANWPLEPVPGRPGAEEPDPANGQAVIDVRLSNLHLGQLGTSSTDARLLSAILARGHRVGRWLNDAGISVDVLDAVYPGSAWRR
jgi:hypothetical protein